MTPQNMLPWYIDDLELKALDQQQVQGEAFSALLLCLETGPPKGTQLS